MGRLAGFRYREIVRRLKLFGYEFHRQGAGSHEIWRHPVTLRYTAIP
ncbi:MAG: type II toxin-antitoxin system HicA family toxin, partial [Rhodomicrobium sp.]